MCKHHTQVYINSVKCQKRSMKLSGKNANCFKFCYLVSKIQIQLLTVVLYAETWTFFICLTSFYTISFNTFSASLGLFYYNRQKRGLNTDIMKSCPDKNNMAEKASDMVQFARCIS